MTLTDDQLDQLITDLGLRNPHGGRPRQPIHHGELRGARAHRRRGEKPCERCRLAEATYARDRYRAAHHPDWLDLEDDRTYVTEAEWQQITAARAHTGGDR